MLKPTLAYHQYQRRDPPSLIEEARETDHGD